MVTKSTIMRKLLPLLLIVLFAGSAKAQTVSFSLITQPCNNNGVLKAYFSGLTPPITVTWTTMGSTGGPIVHTGVAGLNDVLTGYSGGPVNFVATDTSGATDVGTYAGSAPFSYGFNIDAATCPALDTIDYLVFGGLAPYTVQWYNMATLATVATTSPAYLPEGNYGITITDANGCVYGSRVDPNYASLTSTPSFTLATSATVANCTDGTASVTAVGGGTPPFSYQWSTGATTPNIIDLVTGTYSVKVSDANGCYNNASVTVNQGVNIVVPVVATAASCLDSNGTASAYGSGGTAPYRYLWTNGEKTQFLTGLSSGTYSVMVTDDNGCIGSGSATVANTSPINYTKTSSPSLCTSPTGNATIAVSGGTPPYAISWHTTPAQTAVTATGLKPGDYYFHVTDAMGCVEQGTVTVIPVSTLALSYSPVAALCSLSTGSINVIPSGGVAPYTYQWSTGATTPSLTAVAPGNYDLTVTDNLGCKISARPYVGAYTPMSSGIVSTPATCPFLADGINTITGYGGNSPYTYAWSSGGSTATISALPEGAFWGRVTDATGCTTPWQYSYIRSDEAASGCFCTIEGTVYYDANGNCLRDPGERGLPRTQIYISGRGYTYTDDEGHYTSQVPAGTYTITETIRTNYHLSTCQLNGIPVIAAAGPGCHSTVDFANTVDTFIDMRINTWDYSAPTPGRTYTQTTIITNDGALPHANIRAAYAPDGQAYEPSFTPSRIFTGSPYSYHTPGTFPTLDPGAAHQSFMTYHVPTNIPDNTILMFRDSVVADTPELLYMLLDKTPRNNVNAYTTNTSTTYGAQFAQVSPKGSGTSGLIPYTDSVLEFMIHFQNTGATMAQNVMVIDTLDDNLDWTTLMPTFLSAACHINVQAVGARRVATFRFNNINLPRSADNPIGSNGMFTFTVHVKPGLAVGSQIRNRASVYFDYHEPERTNMTLNTILNTAGVEEVAAGNIRTFTIYPNPASQSFNAIINSDVEGSAVMTITDITGKTLATKTVALQKGQQTINTDASSLAPGMYFVSFNDHGNVQTAKLVIMK